MRLRHLRIQLLDQCVAGGRIAQIVPPAFDRGAGEARDRIGIVFQECRRGHHGVCIGRIALLGEQEELDRHVALHGEIRLSRQIARHRRGRVVEEGREVRALRRRHVVGETEALLEPGPIGGIAVGAEIDLAALDLGERGHVRPRHQPDQVGLEAGEDRLDRRALLDAAEDGDVVAHDHVGFAAEEELHAVELRVALPQLHVEPGLLVEPRCRRLVEAAVLGLGKPVGEHAQLGRGARRPRAQERGAAERHPSHNQPPPGDVAHDVALSCCRRDGRIQD